jgi:outer membrane protein
MLWIVLGTLLAAPVPGQGVPSPEPSPLPAPAPSASPLAGPSLVTQAPADDPDALPPGTPTIGLVDAVAVALERNFGLLSAADSVITSRLREGVSRAQFYPRLTPRFERSSDDSALGLDATQRLPWTGGSLSASAIFQTRPDDVAPFPRSSDLRVSVRQPLLRGFGPNATFFELRSSRRGREGQERAYVMGRQRLAVDVTRSFYQVIQQRQLLAVARQSYKRSESLRKASQARLEVGLVSKLDVFRAELQEAQAQESMVRAETSQQAELERFRTLLGLTPTDAIQPEAAELPDNVTGTVEPLEVLVLRALENRVDLQETRDQVKDARRAASLARQNLLPQLDLNVTMSDIGYGTSFGGALRQGDPRVEVFVSSTLPLERAGDMANKATADMAVVAQQRALRQKELEVENEVRAAVRELDRLQKSIELQKKGVDVAEQQRRLATLRYQRGLASNFDVVDAEGNLVLARSALVGLLTNYRVARVDLMRVTGTLDVNSDFMP